MLKNTTFLIIWFTPLLQMRKALLKQFGIQVFQTNVRNLFFMPLHDLKIILRLIAYFNLEIFTFCKPHILAFLINSNYIKLHNYNINSKNWFIVESVKESEISIKEYFLEHIKLVSYPRVTSIVSTFNLSNTLVFGDILHLLTTKKRIN